MILCGNEQVNFKWWSTPRYDLESSYKFEKRGKDFD